jgi:ABC-type sulfate transport system permease component
MILNLFFAELLSYFTEKGRWQEAEGIVTLLIFLPILLPPPSIAIALTHSNQPSPHLQSQPPTADSSTTASCSQPAFVVMLYLFKKTDT